MNCVLGKIGAALLAFLLGSCDGGGPAPDGMKLLAADGVRRMAMASQEPGQPTNSELVAARLYQAFHGKAASTTTFSELVVGISKSGASTVAAAKASQPSISSASDEELALLILTNLDVSTSTVSSKESYDLLLSALTQMFTGYGKAARGQIILNLSTLLAGLESDATWGAAARRYVKRISSNFAYSKKPTSTIDLPIFDFVQTAGTNLTLHGEVFRFAGTNADWIHRLGQKEIESNLKRFAEMNFKVIRTWAYSEIGSLDNSVPAIFISDNLKTFPYFQYWDINKKVPVISTERLVSLDRLLAEAGKQNMKVILTLTNNWANGGGMDQYNIWFKSRYHDDFYTNPEIIAAFKRYIDSLLDRRNTITGKLYREDPAILSWQLANEPFCFTDSYSWRSVKFFASSNCTAETIKTWVEEISGYIRAKDSAHLISIGNIGFLNRGRSDEYSNAAGDDFELTLGLSTIDFGTFHLRIDSPDRPYTVQWGIQWISDHLIAAAKLGKPVILQEFGHSKKADQAEVLNTFAGTVLNQGGAGWLVWGFPVIVPDGSYLGGNGEFSESDPAGTVIRIQAGKINTTK